jgi:hypothetical protein
MATARPESSPAGGVVRFLTASLARELGVLLYLSVTFPFLIHLLPVPGDARLGPRLLPMFYAPLLAALWGRPRSAWALALAAPWLNWALTTYPAVPGAIVMTVELLGFVSVLRALRSGPDARWFLAAPAYACGKAASTLLTMLVPALIGGRAALVWAAQSVAVGAPGIAILVLINWLAVRYHPPGGPAGA